MSSVNIRIVPINRTHRGAPGNNEREKRHTAREKEEGRERARGRVTGERNRVQQLDGSRRRKWEVFEELGATGPAHVTPLI